MQRLDLNCGKNGTSINQGYSVSGFYVSSVGYMRVKCLVTLYLVFGLVTILCHASSLVPAMSYFKGIDWLYDTENISASYRPESSSDLESGKKPKAKDDFAVTTEDTPVTINVLSNDEEGEGDDGEGDDEENENDNEIDIGTVDLNPSTQTIDPEVTTSAGHFIVNTIGEITYTPSQNYTGTAGLQYTVNSRGGETSNHATLTITVNNVDDEPVITGQTPDPLTATEEQSFTIALANLLVTDTDNSYPTGFTLQVAPGTGYTASGNTVTPATNFSGNLVVPVTVNDGQETSGPFNFQVTVLAVNDAPVITGQTPNPLTTGEDVPFTIEFSHLLVSDPDNNYPTGFSMTVSQGVNYSVSGTTVTPLPDFAGTLSVPVTVNDGASNSNTFTLALNVSAANDRPQITGQSPLNVEEDNAVTIQLSHLLVTDNDNPYPTGFTLALAPGDNYSVSGTTVTPAANFSGALSVPVTVNDGTSTSDPFNLVINVAPVNDVPFISGQSAITTGENQSVQLDLSQLVVADPDHAYPAGFTLSVSAGTNYTVSGTSITPSAGFNGTLSVGVFVNDGVANSNVFNLQVTVTAVNDPPVITAQSPLTVAEDEPITIQFSDLAVSDPDNAYPAGFTLTVLTGADYTFSGTTVTPAQNFTGTLSVSVVVNDGVNNSQPFPLQLAVAPVNDAPVITGQQLLSTNEDQAITLDFAGVAVNDVDNTYPSGFMLLAFAGANYTLSGLTVIPSPDFQGTLSVPVQVSDGALNSNIFDLQVAVNATNDTPVITGQVPLSTGEDTPATITLTHLTVLDGDNAYPTGFTLNVLPGANYSVSGTTVIPALDFNGTLNVNVTVSDGFSTSESFVFQIQVGNANDPPVIVGQNTLSTNEEQAFTLQLTDLIVSDPDNPYPVGFSILIALGENFTAVGNTITPSLNFAGVLTVPVRVNDGVNNSATFDLKLAVNQINDAPSFDAIANQKLAENETAADVVISNISKGPGEDGQQITFIVTSGNTAVIPDPVVTYNGTGTSATLKYTPVANVSGTVTITVVAVDNGSTGLPHQNTYSATFQVEVSEINSAPTLEPLSDLTVQEDAALQSVSLWGITAGIGESQPLSVEVSSDKPDLFEVIQVVYTSPAATGTLQLKPNANAYGSAKVTIKVTDNGSSISPSVNSVFRSFTFKVNAVNDPPVFISIPVLVAAVNEMYTYTMEIHDLENRGLPFSALEKPAWLTLTNLGDGKARLAGIPPAAALGPSSVKVIVADGEVTAEQQFIVVVNTRPTVLNFSVDTDEDMNVKFQNQFQQAYSDADNHAMQSILITQVPSSGKLQVSSQEIKANDTIAVSALSSLEYHPDLNYNGQDAFFWKGFDGYHHSAEPASVAVTIRPINDPPVMTLETDTLKYEVNGEPAPITTLFAIEDPDDDSLTRADVAFRAQNFFREYDVLIFQNTGNIRGFYDYSTGKLSLTGKAPLAEYALAIRSIHYNHLNTLDPELKMKSIFITLHDGKASSEERDRLIMPQYTFIDLEIPSGFTPNGDQANDSWIISRPGGIEKLKDAEIKVFNKRGIQVFRARGFERPWDGTINGEVLPADSYFYMIDLNLRNKKTYRGIVTILR
jgi:gliding motility-associated-like protein